MYRRHSSGNLQVSEVVQLTEHIIHVLSAVGNNQICISQLVHKIAAKFRRLNLRFLGPAMGIVAMLYDQTGRNRKWKIQDDGF